MTTEKTLVIVPVFNEADALRAVLPALKEVVGTADILVMCNGSTDGSANVAEECGIRACRQLIPGKPGAVRSGFEVGLHDGYDYLIVFDGDGQHPVDAIPTMMTLLQEHAIVKGTRFHDQSLQLGTPLDRRMIGVATRAWVREFTGVDYTDPPCGLIGLRAAVVKLLMPALGWQEEWEMELLFLLAHTMRKSSGTTYSVHEFPIPAIYRDLPGEKQRAKYDPAAWSDRLSERLTRQAAAIHRFAARYCSEEDP